MISARTHVYKHTHTHTTVLSLVLGLERHHTFIHCKGPNRPQLSGPCADEVAGKQGPAASTSQERRTPGPFHTRASRALGFPPNENSMRGAHYCPINPKPCPGHPGRKGEFTTTAGSFKKRETSRFSRKKLFSFPPQNGNHWAPFLSKTESWPTQLTSRGTEKGDH